ncbi:Hypothetical predicted protein [Lecanosticta acicola]|uniref:DUF3835 domain-containing protein n=1 Tax=Lecanosticta acicola TaxID=111012 RepID=A0AAI9ED07_9PEZI|nr:Hypothetical predicted protein [Lecanosticta acicola]
MDLLRLEQQRKALEQSLQKLRASLQHWQTFDAEYEGLREELHSLSDTLDIESISKSYPGDLVNEKEIRELASLDSPSPRTASQILGIVSRRQEYVQKNIETVQRQFWDAEAKLEELDFVAVTSAHREEGRTASLPLTEIHEELDDEGNVLSSTLSRPEESTANIIDSLRKAGLAEKDLDAATDDQDADDHSATTGSHNVLPPALVDKRYKDSPNTEDKSTGEGGSRSRPPVRKKSVSFTADTKPSPEPVRSESEDGKKTVSFNDKIAVMPAAPPPDPRTVSFSPTVEEIPAEPAVSAKANMHETQAKSDDEMQRSLRGMFKPGEKVYELGDDEEVLGSHIVIPEGESEEDARLRREMINYHLHEVGHIVAEMNLEEGMDDGYDDEDESASASDLASSQYLDEDTPYTSGLSDSDNESEDEHGRRKRRVISDDYHQQMKELESRLIGNLGPAPSDDTVADIDPHFDPADVRKLVIRASRGSQSSASSENDKKAAGKKRVSFAEALDVADEIVPPTKAAKLEDGENAAPVSEMVTERSAPGPASAPSMPFPAKTSRFQQARSSASAAESSTMNIGNGEHDSDRPTGPAGKIIADTLLERNVPRQGAAPPLEDDPIMQRRELAAEYYRRRNDMIRQQGGFKAAADEDQDMGELMEERDGKLKKVSKFRAARIKPQ